MERIHDFPELHGHALNQQTQRMDPLQTSTFHLPMTDHPIRKSFAEGQGQCHNKMSQSATNNLSCIRPEDQGKSEKEKKKRIKKSRKNTIQTSTLQTDERLARVHIHEENHNGLHCAQTFQNEFMLQANSAFLPTNAFIGDEKTMNEQPQALSRDLLDPHWLHNRNLSVVSDELSCKLSNELSNAEEACRKDASSSFQLLVSYLVSMGTDLQTSEEIANSFMMDSGLFANEPRKLQNVALRPDRGDLRSGRRYNSTAKASRAKNQSEIKASKGTSANRLTSSPVDIIAVDDEESADAAFAPTPFVQATEVQDCTIDFPIIWVETSKIGLKDFFKERPVRIALIIGILGFLLLIVGVVAIIIVFTSQNGPVVAETRFPTISPSSTPTMIKDDFYAFAMQLSEEESLMIPNSPQFRAVSWMSTFDSYGAIDLGATFAQRYAMVVLFYSFKGENWIDQENWLDPNLHECDWSVGITCNDNVPTTRVVTGFDATRNNLQGTIAEEIEHLTALETLRIPKNKVGGIIPSTIGRMSSLSLIDCSYNSIEGSIPHSIGNATNLVSVDFTENKLLYRLPQELFSLRNVQTVALASNNLTGSLAEELSALTSLVSLDLRNNRLTGTLPWEFISSTLSLAILYLDRNQLTGKLPYVTPQLGRMEVISLAHNKFSGNLEIHPDFFNLENPYGTDDFRLKHVDISFNELSGPISVVFGLLPSMRFLDISGNAFSGSFPSDVGWYSIEYLAAAENDITGTIPLGYPTLTHLDMSTNQFRLGIPEELCEYKALKHLKLNNNTLGSTIPSCLGQLSMLQVLDLSHEHLVGSIPTSLGQLTELEHLELGGNALEGSFPSQLGNLSNMMEISFSENALVGTLPSELGKLTKLKRFQASNNSLTGSLPSEMSAWTDLEQLVLLGNEMVGTIPKELCEINGLDLTSRDVGCAISCSCCKDSTFCLNEQ